MKRLILFTVLIFAISLTHGQNLQKGNLVGTHVMTVTLQPGVTMDQFMEVFKSKVLPVYNIDPDWNVYLVKSIRGNVSKDSFGLIHIVKSDQVRDRFYNIDGSRTELGKSWSEKLKPIMEELKKYGTYTTTWSDWIVQ
jgi:hypothetical protein